MKTFFLRVICLWIFFAQNDIHSTLTMSHKASFSFCVLQTGVFPIQIFYLKMINIACHVVTRNTFFSHIFFCVAAQYNLTRTDQYLLRKNWCVGAKIILNRFLLFLSQRLRQSENFSSQIFFFTNKFRFQNFLHFCFIDRWLKEVFLIYK